MSGKRSSGPKIQHFALQAKYSENHKVEEEFHEIQKIKDARKASVNLKSHVKESPQKSQTAGSVSFKNLNLDQEEKATTKHEEIFHRDNRGGNRQLISQPTMIGSKLSNSYLLSSQVQNSSLVMNSNIGNYKKKLESTLYAPNKERNLEEFNFPSLDEKSVDKNSPSPILKNKPDLKQNKLKILKPPSLKELEEEQSGSIGSREIYQETGESAIFNSGKISPVTSLSKISKNDSRHMWLRKQPKKDSKLQENFVVEKLPQTKDKGMKFKFANGKNSFKRVLEDFKRFGIDEDDSDDTDFGNSSNQELKELSQIGGANPLDDDYLLALDDDMIDGDDASLPDSGAERLSQITAAVHLRDRQKSQRRRGGSIDYIDTNEFSNQFSITRTDNRLKDTKKSQPPTKQKSLKFKDFEQNLNNHPNSQPKIGFSYALRQNPPHKEIQEGEKQLENIFKDGFDGEGDEEEDEDFKEEDAIDNDSFGDEELDSSSSQVKLDSVFLK